MSPRELNYHLCKQQGKKNKPTKQTQDKAGLQATRGWGGRTLLVQSFFVSLRNFCPEFHSRTPTSSILLLFWFPRLCAPCCIRWGWNRESPFYLLVPRKAFVKVCVSSTSYHSPKASEHRQRWFGHLKDIFVAQIYFVSCTCDACTPAHRWMLGNSPQTHFFPPWEYQGGSKALYSLSHLAGPRLSLAITVSGREA